MVTNKPQMVHVYTKIKVQAKTVVLWKVRDFSFEWSHQGTKLCDKNFKNLPGFVEIDKNQRKSTKIDKNRRKSTRNDKDWQNRWNR